MINGKKLYELIYKKEKVDPKTTRILDNCLNAKITNSHKEGILEDVGKVLKKHGANTILTMVVLNFFRKMFGRNSLTIRKNDNNLYNLYDNDRLIFSSNNKNLVEEKKYEIESTKKEGIIFVDNKNIEVDFSPSNKKAKDKLGNIYIQKDGKWFKENFKQELKIDKKHIKKIKDLDIFFDVVGDEIYVDESEEQRLKTLNIPFRESLTLEEQRMWQFIIKRYPNADHKFRLQKFNNLKNKVKESFKEQKTNEEVWLNWAMNTDSQDLEELHEILKTLHRNNKLSTIRMQELKDENGQEIKDSLIDLLGNYEESGLNTSNTGSLVGQKLAGTKTPNKIKLDKTKLDDDLSIEINVLKEKLNKKRKFYI